MAVLAGLLAAQFAMAQAPAEATGQCKDGTYSTAASKQGACRGHEGVKEWYAAASAAPAPSAAASTPVPAKAATTPVPAKAATTHASTASTTQAAGGGPGMVWLNTGTNVYHCPGSQYYGKTKAGSYMSEADARAKGAHADHNKPCTK
jgi:Protein of unknown function (DUF3761)